MGQEKRIVDKWNPVTKSPDYNKKLDELLFSELKVIPFIYKVLYKKVIKLALIHENTWGLLVIKGPRRIGKTTLLYYLVYRALKDTIDAKNILYLSLDDPNLDFKLLERILEQHLLKKGKKIVLLDEASFIPEWNRILKNLIDRGIVQDSIIVVTGSYGVDLEEAERLLYGRVGNVYNIRGSLKSGAFQFLFPLRFSEIVNEFEVCENLKSFLIKKNVAKRKTLPSIREGLLRNLVVKKEDISFLEEIDDVILNSLSSFFKTFVLTGGFPKYFKDYISSEFSEQSLIRAYNDFYQLIKADGKKLFPKYYQGIRFHDDVFDTLIKVLTEYVGGQFNVEDILNKVHEFLSRHTLKRIEINAYLDFMLTTKLIYTIKPAKLRGEDVEFAEGKRKLYFRDSLIYLAFYSRTRNINNVIEIQRTIKKKNLYGPLFENIVVRHLVELPFLTEPAPIDMKSFEEKNLGYYEGKFNKEKFEIDAVTWFREYKGEKRILLAEITTQDKKDISLALNWVNKEFPNYRLIVMTEEYLEVNKDVLFIPAYLLLSLI